MKNAASFTRTGSPTAVARNRLSSTKKREKKKYFAFSHKKILSSGIQPPRPRRYFSKKPQPVDVTSRSVSFFSPELTDNETRPTHFPPADDRSTCLSNSSVMYKHSVQPSRLCRFGPPPIFSLSPSFLRVCVTLLTTELIRQVLRAAVLFIAIRRELSAINGIDSELCGGRVTLGKK